MHGRTEQTQATTVLGEGRYLRLVEAGGWEFAERTRAGGIVAVVAVTDDERLVLTEQHRPAVKTSVIDLPAGLASDADEFHGEDEQTAAARELEEETGFAAQSWTKLVTVPTSPGLTSETVTLFLAEQLHRTGEGGGDMSEDITVHLIPLAELAAWLDQQTQTGRLIDPKIYAGLWLRETRARRT